MLRRCLVKNLSVCGLLQNNGSLINIISYFSNATNSEVVAEEYEVKDKHTPYTIGDCSWKKWWQSKSVGKHPGKCNLPAFALPDRFNDSAKLYLDQHKDVIIKTVAEKLSAHLASRRSCKEKNFDAKQEKTKSIPVLSRNKKLPPVTDDIVALLKLPMSSFEKIVKSNMDLQKQSHPYRWKQIEYDAYNAAAYLVARSPGCYASSLRVMNEIKKKVPDFQPSTILDFGSGTGMSIWAANSLWQESLKQYVCIDTSKCMNDLSFFLFAGGNYDRPLPGLFIRQSLPSSLTNSYDIVIASYTLSELPSDTERIALLKMLWKKTKRYLILIENGNFYGYYIMMEARNLLLQGLEGVDKKTTKTWSKFSTPASIFSPCPHRGECPMWRTKSSCGFKQNYIMPNYTKKYGYKNHIAVEKFSYMVFEKTVSNSSSSWPRVISNPNPGKNMMCHICTSDGNIEHPSVTKAKCGTELLHVVKKCKIGDSIPLFPPDNKNTLD